MSFYGDTSPATDPLRYVACVKQLLAHVYTSQHGGQRPLIVVNTPGWIRVCSIVWVFHGCGCFMGADVSLVLVFHACWCFMGVGVSWVLLYQVFVQLHPHNHHACTYHHHHLPNITTHLPPSSSQHHHPPTPIIIIIIIIIMFIIITPSS